jgi:hypothetical protein
MAPWVAVRHNVVRKACYARLRTAGKAKTVALGAGLRNLLTILHAMAPQQTPGQPREVAIA